MKHLEGSVGATGPKHCLEVARQPAHLEVASGAAEGRGTRHEVRHAAVVQVLDGAEVEQHPDARLVEKTQEPSIQASGIFSQLKTKPPTVPMAMASSSGLRPSWPMMCFFSDLKGIALLLKDRTAL